MAFSSQAVDDLALIDCVERLRTHLASADERLAERCLQLRHADYRALTNDELKLHLTALALDVAPDTPAGKRTSQMALHQVEQTTQVAERTEGNAAMAPAWTVVGDERRQAATDLLRQSLEKFQAEFSGEGQFTVELQRSVGGQAAAAFVGRTLPALRGRKAYEFLVRIGYPAAVPWRDSMRLLHRLGLLGDVRDDANGRRAFFDRIERIGKAAMVPLPELDFLLSTFARGDSRAGLKGVCVPEPKCSNCALSSQCVSFRYRGVPQRAETMPIKTWAREDRPRERLLAGERLSSGELLGIILRTGTGAKSAVDLGREVIQKFGSLHRLEAASPKEIMDAVPGIGPAKAAEIRAAIELGRRIAQPAADDRDGLKQVVSSQDIFEIYRPRYKSATQEEFLLLALNTKNRIQREISVSVGTLNASIVHPRDVFNHALREAAAGVIFVHNHPSGDPAPSPEDHALTRRLVEAGNLLGIKVLDHVIIGAQRYYSFADEGALG